MQPTRLHDIANELMPMDSFSDVKEVAHSASNTLKYLRKEDMKVSLFYGLCPELYTRHAHVHHFLLLSSILLHL